MVATASTLRYFSKTAHDEGVWHAYRDDGRISLCGEAQLTYNVDPISDSVPSGGTLHAACQRARDGEPEPGAAPAKKKTGKKT